MLLFLFFISFKAERWLWDNPCLHVGHKGSKSAEQNCVLRGSLTFSWAALGFCHPFSSFPSCNRDTKTELREASLH